MNITAEEFSKKYTRLRSAAALKDLSDFATDFAKYHLEQAEKAWFEKIKSEGLVTDEGVQYLRNVYSKDNII
jgi:hypothetical protein